MGLFEKLGIDGLGLNFDLGTLLTATGKTILAILIMLFIGAVVFMIFLKKKSNQLDKHNVHWAQQMKDEKMWPIEDDLAREVVVPGTNIVCFYIKKKDMYIPRLTRMYGKNHYFVGVTPNGEIINYDVKGLNKDLNESGLDYDKNDMKLANENLRDFINRNFRQKSLKWWQEYKDIIGLVILIFCLTLSQGLLFYYLSKIMGSLGGLIDKIDLVADKLIQALDLVRGSGVVKA